MTKKDDGKVAADEAHDLVSISRDEYRRLLASASAPNLAPAIEEGPHLDDPEIREAKLRQLRDAGITAKDEGLTDHMRSLLEGED